MKMYGCTFFDNPSPPFSLTPVFSSPTIVPPTEVEPSHRFERAQRHALPLRLRPKLKSTRGLPMILQLHKTKPAPDICLIAFTGKLMMGHDSRQVEWSISELLIAGIKKIIFDLSNLDGIDSTGVGILVMCQAKMQKAGGMLRIAGPHGIVQETLTLTHVDKLVPFFPSADLAAQNFNPS